MTTDDRLVSGASSLNPNKSSGDIGERLRAAYEWIRRPDWEEEFSLEDIAAWMNKRPSGLLLESAAEIERLRRDMHLMGLERDRIARNRDMWKGQCERQADQLRQRSALTAESAVAAAWEEAARVAKDRWREWRSSYEDDLDGMDACEDISKAISARASAIRAAHMGTTYKTKKPPPR